MPQYQELARRPVAHDNVPRSTPSAARPADSTHTGASDRIIRLKELLTITGLGRSTIYKLISDGTLERPVKLTERAVGWRSSTVNAFLQSRSSTGVR